MKKLIISENILSKKIIKIEVDDIAINISKNLDKKKQLIATFIDDIKLFRGMVADELFDIFINKKPITGGDYSSEIEREVGASFACAIEDAIEAATMNRKFFIL